MEFGDLYLQFGYFDFNPVCCGQLEGVFCFFIPDVQLN